MAGTERLLELLEELGQQVKGHCHQAQNVQQEGQQLVDNGHFMSLERYEHRGGSGAGHTAQLPKASEP